jgi:hypothetical protein
MWKDFFWKDVMWRDVLYEHRYRNRREKDVPNNFLRLEGEIFGLNTPLPYKFLFQ